MDSVITLFDQMWRQYVTITPSAYAIHSLLSGGDAIANDHVAYRTFNHAKVGLPIIANLLQHLGFKEKGEYYFQEKKLYAKHYQHPNQFVPKVFVSELLLENCSDDLRNIVNTLVEQVPNQWGSDVSCLTGGAPWEVGLDDYESLARESEYGGWLAAFGYRANHFTVSVNHLAGYDSLSAVVDSLRKNNFQLNESGGVIKGGSDVYLEQASTLADITSVALRDASIKIPGCFYEFAYRYPLPSGEIFQGFVEASANKIFESTDQPGKHSH